MDTPDSTTLKRCSKCGEEKPRDQFSNNNSKKDGLQVACKACNRVYRQANADHSRAYRQANAERIAAQQRKYYQENPEKKWEHDNRWHKENPEKTRETRTRRYYANADKEKELRRHRYYANADKERERARYYREKNPDKRYDSIRRYREENVDKLREKARYKYKENPEAGRAIAHNRRVRKRGNGGTYTTADLTAIRAAQTDKKGRLICWRCGKPITDTPHLDHWIPLSKGGTNDAGNLRYMHAKCNLSKGAKLPHEIGRLL